MKHYSRLTELETVFIDLDMIVSTMRAISGGVEEINMRDTVNTMYFLTDQIEKVSNQGMDCFQILFEEIKNEKPEKKPVRKAK
jgi:hypothetical protein